MGVLGSLEKKKSENPVKVCDFAKWLHYPYKMINFSRRLTEKWISIVLYKF